MSSCICVAAGVDEIISFILVAVDKESTVNFALLRALEINRPKFIGRSLERVRGYHLTKFGFSPYRSPASH
jgi:hypothetical protein